MTIKCPNCRSESVVTKDLAKKVTAFIGTLGGAARGYSGALAAAQIGSSVGMIAGPAGAAVGGLAGGILGALTGGTAGCMAGAKLGEVIDDRVLNNYHCLACGQDFSNRATN